MICFKKQRNYSFRQSAFAVCRYIGFNRYFSLLEMEGANVSSTNIGSRKKIHVGKNSKLTRNEKYKDKNPQAVGCAISCQHSEKSKFQCSNLTTEDIVKNRRLLYEKTGKVAQDLYLTRLIRPHKPVRLQFISISAQPKARQFSCNYFLLCEKKRKLLSVCKALFLKALSLGMKRINSIGKVTFNGNIPQEKRGGDRKSSKTVAKRESIAQFIGSLHATESHYGRNKSKRIYLSCDLNIKKLWKIYNNSMTDENLKVKESLFRDVFLKKFNIGFSPPA